VGGSPGFTGATYLSSLSALRIGSGAVVLGIPASLNHILETKTTEVITLPLEDTKEQTLSENAYSKISERIKWADAILLGPGLGRNEESLSLIRNIIKQNDERFVIDADGLFAFKDKPELLKKKKNKIIITPHYGEFSNLSGFNVDEIKKDIVNISKTFAKKYNVILVLKNSPTIITDGDYFYINPSGKENLATIGTGDVLAGIISGLYSQIKEPLQSALLGVYIHGKCGDEIYRKTGNSSTIAGDLIEKIPEIKMQLLI
jgi:NAD(P)H-hydrate epimerase